MLYAERHMSKEKSGNKPTITIRNLYPYLNDEQLKEAEENLTRYVELVLRIYERIQKDPEASTRFRVLTASGRNTTMKERSHPACSNFSTQM